MIGQSSLNTFYQSVHVNYPTLAARMSENVVTVAIHSLGNDKSEGQIAADSLREQAASLPEALRRVLENALIEMGYR